MTISNWLEEGLRGAIAAVFFEGIRCRNPGAIVNAVLAFAATYFPVVVEHQYGVTLRPWQRVYVKTGMLMHAVGMLGPYDDIWWWDHLTHTHSATILGGFIHVISRQRDRDPRPHVLAGVFAIGVLWELAEYAIHFLSRRMGLDPLLVSYGKKDTFLDIVFNLFGAFLVIVFADTFLENLTQSDGDS
ncbi:hypothetical protein [Haladaptatus halobius]|uniref:hypothetical protein n=1 Tax=Haladaptatus halobius TaxID=2884875 RepID=UPI001D0BCE6E|nr:hypothetical protein [Haladaptatus halobius]